MPKTAVFFPAIRVLLMASLASQPPLIQYLESILDAASDGPSAKSGGLDE
jgi:hypothetical protein